MHAPHPLRQAHSRSQSLLLDGMWKREELFENSLLLTSLFVSTPAQVVVIVVVVVVFFYHTVCVFVLVWEPVASHADTGSSRIPPPSPKSVREGC